MAASHSRARGEGKVGCLLTLAVLMAAGALAYKVVPVYYADSNLADYASDVAGEAGLNEIPALQAKLRTKAQELEIPEALDEGAITIHTTGTRAAGSCTIVLDYTQTVDLYGIYPLVITTRKAITRQYMDLR
jgi:hypothetical protein